MKIYEEISAFREIVVNLLEVEEIEAGTPIVSLTLPKSLFMDAVRTLKRGTSLTKEELLLLGKEFLSVLDEKPIRIINKDRNFFLGKNLKKRKEQANWITQEVMRGAFGHEKSQPRDAI